MKAHVVYESMYGNTHRIAEAIADGLQDLGRVVVGPTVETTPEILADVDLLVVGGPTHMHGMSNTASRRAAMETAEKNDAVEADPDATVAGLRSWFKDLPKTKGRFGAAFDTRIGGSTIVTGSAAKSITKLLRRHHFEPLGEPASFLVEDAKGPLKDGELERARRWGADLADLVIAHGQHAG
jgi:flavodoxin